MKVKKRFKLVMPSSSKSTAKLLAKHQNIVEDDEGEDGMEEVMVEEVLAQSNAQSGDDGGASV